MAQYRIHQESYINDRHILANAEVEVAPYARKRVQKKDEAGRDVVDKTGKKVFELVDLHHKPGPHWEPLDDEARAICERHKHEFTGFVPDAVEDLSKQLEEAQAKAAASAAAGGGLDAATIAAIVAQTVNAILDARGAGKGK